MIATLIIVFREVLEAGLIIGIVLAVTRGLPGNLAWVGRGIAGGMLGALLVALFAGAIASAFEGVGQELLNAGVLAFAALMLGWHNVWMATHARELAAGLREVGRQVADGRKPLMALAIVIAIAVFREGAEVVLFLFGIAAGGATSRGMMFAGGVGGLALGALVSLLTYRGLLALPVGTLFSVTGWLITLLAAGMAAHAVSYLEQAGVITLLGETAWDSSAILAQDSLMGTVLHALIGYVDRPTLAQALAWALTFAVITAAAALLRRSARSSAVAPPEVAAARGNGGTGLP